MIHRHLSTTGWSKAAIDSALEYGDLADWRELFAAVRADRSIAEDVLAVAAAHEVPGSSAMARVLVAQVWPGLAAPDRARG